MLWEAQANHLLSDTQTAGAERTSLSLTPAGCSGQRALARRDEVRGPHGKLCPGCPSGLADPTYILMAGCDSLRDVIAFPKTTRAVCQLTDAPSSVHDDQLAELGLDLRPAVKARLKEGHGAGESA